MSTLRIRRGAAVSVAAALTAMSALAIAQQAQASTIYACVKKNGTARFTSKQAKCKKGETKLSWNTEGPAGKAGLNGAAGKDGAAGKNGSNGSNGSNGAVAGFSAVGTLAAALPTTIEEEVLVLSKSLPAGSYLISAKAVGFASATSNEPIDVRCELYENNGLIGSSELDESEFTTTTTFEYQAGKYEAAGTLSMQAAISTGAATQVQIWCERFFGAATIHMANAKIWAVQTSSNS